MIKMEEKGNPEWIRIITEELNKKKNQVIDSPKTQDESNSSD